MKRIYRQRALKRLYAELESKDFDSREYALFQLALMLRRSHADGERAAAGGYVDELPRELLRIRLGSADQRAIAAALSRLIMRYPASRATAFWTLSELDSALGWQPMIALIGALGAQLSHEAAYQACAALRRWLLDGGDPAPASLLRNAQELRQQARAWSAAGDARLARSAQALLLELEAPPKTCQE